MDPCPRSGRFCQLHKPVQIRRQSASSGSVRFQSAGTYPYPVYCDGSQTVLPQQQSVMACVDTVKLFKDGIDIIEFTITYSDGINKYNEKYKINFLADTDTAKSRVSTDGKELKIISYTLQDFVERLL